MARITRAASVALLSLGALSAAANGAEAKKPERVVFAHYMVCFHQTVDFYKGEIQIAQRHGIDGFATDFGQWCRVKNGTLEPTGYVTALEGIYRAAKELGTGFKILLTPEYSVRPFKENVLDLLKRFHDHPNTFRIDGKMVLSSYARHYLDVHEEIRKRGYDVVYIPGLGAGRHEMNLSFENTLRIYEEHPYTDGLFRFVADNTTWETMNQNANACRASHYLGKYYLAGLSPYYASANIRDKHGMHGYGAVWEGVIDDGADFVEIVTWNDYNEDTQLMHYKWKRQWDKPLYNRDGSYLDVTAYYAQWYKTGRRPAITQDKIFYAYRNRSKWQTKAWNAKQNAWVDVAMKKWPFDQIHDDVEDTIYVTTFLTAPATLNVRVGRKATSFSMDAGVAHAEVPMVPGVPHFTLTRVNGLGRRRTVLDVVGRRRIIDQPTKEDSPDLGHHINHKIWAGGAAAGRAKRLEAESGQLAGGARQESVGSARCVKNATTHGSGFTLPVSGLDDAMYNVRIVYSNAADRDARLSLVSDGPPRGTSGEDKAPYYIPVWFPPTENGNLATASFLWTLYEETTFLKLEWEKGEKPEWDDVGSVAVDAIELVKVETPRPTSARASAFPEMVPIPGGSFTMGSPDGTGAPDERPRHRVTLSPFAIGKCEVTNEEFERFWPEHRKWRDGFSWRDREPVIYFDWREAARYCNWLSKRAGLTPAYDEKTWTRDPSADGFRLPTEAEWEYVATGRGEGRTYPWGDAAPDATRGNFAGATALAIPSHLRSSPAQGTTVVGSYPAGATRDGVMDMAGNVAEWCDDWYQRYAADAKTDPYETRASHSRVIRGGSWGYYNHSQRSTDREFNSQVYPGYIYLGFRVALPMDSYRRLGTKVRAR